MTETKEGLRWWPAWVVLGLAAVALLWVRLQPGLTGQDRTVRSILVVIVTLLLLLVWWLVFSRARWWWRWGIPVGVGLLLYFVVPRLVTVRQVTGDLVPVLEWSWESRPDPTAPDAVTGPGAAISLPGAADYPQFLGPGRNATLPGPALARDWEAQSPKEIWRRPVGAGWSGFAVRGDLAVTQEQHGDEERVVAYDLATGEIRWSHADEGRYDSTIAGVGPRATPTIDDGKVYTHGSLGRLNALDLETGEVLWSHDVPGELEAPDPQWGRSASPLVTDGLVIVTAGGDDHLLAAYDAETGELVWTGGDDQVGYASPFVTTLDGERQIVLLNHASVTGHDPETGEVLWSYPWSAEQPNVAQPVPLEGDRLLVSSGYGVGAELLEIEHDEEGVLRPTRVWKSPRLKAKFTNVVVHEGHVYGLDDGVLVCLDPDTGERCWKRGRYGHGQVILVGDLLLVQTEKGDVALVEPNPDELRELARLPALDSKTWNSPTLAGRYLLVRNDREAAAYELPLAGS